MKTQFLVLTLCVIFAAGAVAEIVTIPDDQPSLAAAVAAIDRNDAAADTIRLNTNALTEPGTVVITGGNGSDELTIDGDGESAGAGDSTACVVSFAAPGATYAIVVTVGSNETVSWNDLDVVPAFAGGGTGATVVAATAFQLNASPNASNATHNLTNVNVTAAAASGSVGGADAWLGGDITQWDAGSSTYCSGIRSESTSGVTNYNINIDDCLNWGRMSNRGIYARHDAGGTMTITNCAIQNNGYTAISSFGLDGGAVVITDCVLANNVAYGIRMRGSGSAWTIDGSTSVTGNADNGVFCEANGSPTVDITGTDNFANAVVVTGNGNRNFRSSGSNTATIDIDYAVFTEAGNYALDFNEVNPNTTTVDHVLAGNGGFAREVNVGLTNTTPATMEINNSTFHGAAEGPRTLWDVNYSGSDNVTYQFTDCLFSGAGLDDTAFGVSNGDGNTFDLTNCAIVLNGANAVSVEFSDTPATNFIAQTAVTNLDPAYVSVATGPITNDSFDVDNVQYTGLGSAASDLSGFGDFIGSTVPVELSIFSAD